MAKRINRNKEFLILAMVSAVIVVAVFATNITSNQPSGYYSKGEVVTSDSTGATFICSWYNGYKWKAEYLNGNVRYLPDQNLDPSSPGVNCLGNLYCDNKLVTTQDQIYCNEDIQGKMCECRGQAGN